MNIAIITAAGIGSRMKLDHPKQYHIVNGKPIIAYTLDTFNSSPDIDEICFVVAEDYLEYAKSIVKDNGFNKVKYFVIGGDTNQMSICNAVNALSNKVSGDSIILVHDGIRPLVTHEVIKDCIDVCKQYGNAIAVTPCNEAMLKTEDGETSNLSIDRNTIMKTQTPHAMRLDDLSDLIQRTLAKGQTSSVAVCTMLIEDGQAVHFSKGNNFNFKITQPEDLVLFESMLKIWKK